MIPFLDIIIDSHIPRSRISRKIIDSLQVNPKPAVPDTTHQDTAQAISGADISGNMQQLADITPFPPETEGLLTSNVTLTILVVILALFLCFHFVRKYRNSLGSTAE